MNKYRTGDLETKGSLLDEEDHLFQEMQNILATPGLRSLVEGPLRARPSSMIEKNSTPLSSSWRQSHPVRPLPRACVTCASNLTKPVQPHCVVSLALTIWSSQDLPRYIGPSSCSLTISSKTMRLESPSLATLYSQLSFSCFT